MNVEDTFRSYVRCVHCRGEVGISDAMDEVCDGCLEKELFEFDCAECDHSWQGVGLQIHCPSCNSLEIEISGSSRVEAVRMRKKLNYKAGTEGPLF